MLHASVGSAGKAQDGLAEVMESVSGLSGAVTGASEAVNLALQQTKESYQTIEAQIDAAMDLFYGDSETARQILTDLSTKVETQIAATQKFRTIWRN